MLTLAMSLSIALADAPSFKLPVRIEITSDDSLGAPLRACVEKELAGIPDVELKEGDRSLTLALIAAEQKMSDGSTLGYLVYEGGYQPGPECKGMTYAPDEARPVLVQWQSLRMYPPDVAKACKRIVEDFAEEVLDPTRESIRQVLGPPKGR